jgi:lysozyme
MLISRQSPSLPIPPTAAPDPSSDVPLMPVNPEHPGIEGRDDQNIVPEKVDFIDVSHFQGKVDWTKYATAGRKLALCKVTEGSDWTDPTGSTNREGMAKAGVECGLYHFAGAGGGHSIGDATKEADFYLSTVGKMGPKEFPALDFEQPDGLTPAQQVSWIGTWCQEVEEKTGKTPWLYTGETMLSKMGQDAAPLTKYPLWVANYNSSDRSQPPPSGAWPELTAWQFTHKAHIPGVQGGVDGSYLYGKMPSPTPFPKP